MIQLDLSPDHSILEIAFIKSFHEKTYFFLSFYSQTFSFNSYSLWTPLPPPFKMLLAHFKGFQTNMVITFFRQSNKTYLTLFFCGGGGVFLLLLIPYPRFSLLPLPLHPLGNSNRGILPVYWNRTILLLLANQKGLVGGFTYSPPLVCI